MQGLNKTVQISRKFIVFKLIVFDQYFKIEFLSYIIRKIINLLFDNDLVNRLMLAWLEIVMNIPAQPLTIFNQQGKRELLEFPTQGKQIFFMKVCQIECNT